MADEGIPEDIDLRFVARQNVRILGELAVMREQTKHVPTLQADVSELKADVSELRHAIAATRTDLAIVKDTVEKIYETQQNHGARLNVLDGRLAIIEKHTGLVKA
jgi:chromosome segregation ATPase